MEQMLQQTRLEHTLPDGGRFTGGDHETAHIA
jgi:hypothetical protein